MNKPFVKILCGALGAVITLTTLNMDDPASIMSEKVNLQCPSLVYASMANRYSNAEFMEEDETDEDERISEEADSEQDAASAKLSGAGAASAFDLDDYTITVPANYEEIAAKVRGEDDPGLTDDDDENYDGKFIWTKDAAKVYASPDPSSKVIAQFKKGSKAIRISYTDEWSYVRFANGGKGYILTKSASTTKVKLPTPTPKPVRRVAAKKSTSSKSSSKKKSTGGGFGSFVRRFVGCKYVAGGASPSGFDCSGFTMYCYKAYYGIKLPHGSNMQTSCGRKVSLSSMKVGDLIFLDHDHNGKSDHVGIYVGSGQMVHASGVKWGVCCVSVKNVKDIMMVRRIR